MKSRILLLFIDTWYQLGIAATKFLSEGIYAIFVLLYFHLFVLLPHLYLQIFAAASYSKFIASFSYFIYVLWCINPSSLWNCTRFATKKSDWQNFSGVCDNAICRSIQSQKHATLSTVLLPELCGPSIRFTLFSSMTTLSIGPKFRIVSLFMLFNYSQTFTRFRCKDSIFFA